MNQVFFIEAAPQRLPQWLNQAILDGRVLVRGDSVVDYPFYVVDGQVATVGQSLVFDGQTITIN
ncbi:hypothetical protein RAY_22 [Erwinia phage vB_EamM_RAY]|jgi:hypothetical protein|uniref:Uncharacterized protein n=10 Tax=Agricanvirus TaxID=1984776 RepID=A0A173GE09_9CAUD|nr:hypothetical protein Ea357_022 [Erwinia phage Ea35-70]YP_009605165.1 hypothetical protein FDH97_gp022 [Erwinia phage vB_EamM_Deimos-Minion]YP_009605489.1 hypothetical protein FDH98_gp022 [Erwinia phage vB_EamM_RAY]YP_009605807.1 hypothetical protein FDH99_gp023 [Erwinia phage vB_EamM_Simmy50]YP_009606128.1 hypothetical protein FDI00_gp022 [Erwinia phage vB_EamM_Special G]YP_009621763.1 hypothetical protein FDJ23_gp022 [Erwinia phage vB_EamM_Desertfox]AUG85810.1 hypothetical protein BOSOLAP